MRPSEASVTISASRTVLSRAVGALIGEFHPGIRISYEDGGNAHNGVDVHLDGTSRWMCILVSATDVEAAKQALANDAWCLAELSSSPEDFLGATDALLTGAVHHLPISFARSIATTPRVKEPASDIPTPPTDHTPLTARERQVLAHVSTGLSNAEIADAMGISVHTVRTHLSSMATKLEVHNRLRLVAKAGLLGYVEATALPKAQ